MPQANKLFFVRSSNDDGESLDLMVVAADKAQATVFWQEYYELNGSTPDWVGAVPGVSPDASCEAGPIDWEAIRMD